MKRHGIPTARHQSFDNATEAHAYVRGYGAPIVIKADGLAAGKGVVVAMTVDEAHAAIDHIFSGEGGVSHNDEGARVVIEEFMEGEEASFIVVCDGLRAIPLATSQDHKRLGTAIWAPTPAAWAPIRPRPSSRRMCMRA